MNSKKYLKQFVGTDIKRRSLHFIQTNPLLVFVFFIAVAVGFYLMQIQLVFTFDQARDAYEALSVTQGNLKIAGPSSDIPGVHHGVAWYYLLALPYAIARGDPQVVGAIFFFITFLTAPLCGLVSYRLFQDRKMSYVATLFYAFSPLFLAFSRWLSNPLYTLYVMPFLLLLLWRYLNKPTGLVGFFLGISFGMLIQSDFAFGIFLFLLPLYFIVFKVKIIWKHLLMFLAGLSLVSLSFLLAEIKFSWTAVKGIQKFLESGGHTLTQSPIERFQITITKLIDLFYQSFLPFPVIVVGIVLVLTSVVLFTKRKELHFKPLFFLLLWLVNLFLFQFFSSGILQSSFIFAPSLMVTILIGAYLVVKCIPGKFLWVVVGLILVSELSLSYSWMQEKYTPLSLQRGFFLTDSKDVIDYTYESSAKGPFIINTITNPLYINTTWSLLYSYYGKNTYGYVPQWAGKDQQGYLGSLPTVTNKKVPWYLIEEPGPVIPELFIDMAQNDMNAITTITEDKRFGEVKVQKRVYKE